MKIKDVISILEESAPLTMQDDFDNSGVQILSDNEEITGIIIAVDLTNDVVDCAIKNSINMIITHHPFFFYPIKSIGNDNNSKLLKKIIKNNINVYSAHTNFDRSKNGMLYSLVEILDIKKPRIFNDGYGVIGDTDISYDNIIKLLKERLNINHFTGRILKKHYTKIGYINGAGGRDESCVDELLHNGVELFITSELKHSVAIKLAETNIDFIELNHGEMESAFIQIVNKMLVKNRFNCNIILYTQEIYNV